MKERRDLQKDPEKEQNKMKSLSGGKKNEVVMVTLVFHKVFQHIKYERKIQKYKP